jgi:tetratricopeptide (TPR) repeat protein
MSNNYQDLKKQADTFRKEHNYVQAVTIYEQIWESDKTDPWLGWAYAYCLRKLDRSKEALDMCREVYRLDPDLQANRDLYGWCVYDIGINQPENNFDESKFINAAKAIVDLTEQGQYSPYERAVFKVIHHYENYKKQNKQVPYQEIISWLEKLDLDLLSASPNSYGGKSYASMKEDWYTSRSKAMLELGRYSECIEVCTEALNTLRTFHYDYDVWFRQQRAESYFELGEFEKALNDLEYMMSRKPDPWIRHKYGLVLQNIGDLEQALRYMSIAAIPSQRLGFRWAVYLDIAKILNKLGEHDLSRKHAQLALAIRQNENWNKIPEDLQSLIQALGISFDETFDAKKIHKELQPYWKSLKPRPKTTHQGTIEKIHSNGKSGLILSNTGTRYFFGIKNYLSENIPDIGQHVDFNLKKTMNRKKNVEELHAVDILISEDN